MWTALLLTRMMMSLFSLHVMIVTFTSACMPYPTSYSSLDKWRIACWMAVSPRLTTLRFQVLLRT